MCQVVGYQSTPMLSGSYVGPRPGLPKQKTADPAGSPYDLWLYLKLAGQGRQRVTNNSLS